MLSKVTGTLFFKRVYCRSQWKQLFNATTFFCKHIRYIDTVGTVGTFEAKTYKNNILGKYLSQYSSQNKNKYFPENKQTKTNKIFLLLYPTQVWQYSNKTWFENSNN